VVGASTLTEPGPVIAIGTRPDSGIVAVGRRSIEVFDRRGDPAGLPVSFPVSDTARVRPDGTVVVVPNADSETMRVIDPTGGPLVEAGWNVGPSALVGFGAEHAAVTSAAGDLELVELSSGDRVPTETTLPDGGQFQALAAVPEDDGFLAWDHDGSVGRWRDRQLTERVELWSGSGDVTLARVPDGPGRPGPEATVGAGAAVIFLNGFSQVVQRFDPNEGSLGRIVEIGSPPRATVAAAPAPDGGVHVVLDDGIVRTYDRAERSVGQVDTGLADPWLAVSDPATGLIGVGGDGGAVVVDPIARTFETVEELGPVASLGFARNGALLVVVGSDGTVSLWDTERSELVGTLWSGDGTAPSSVPWYDATTDSVWVATSGTILQFSLDPERWVDRVCDLVGRELTPQEWDRYVPGDAPHRDACD